MFSLRFTELAEAVRSCVYTTQYGRINEDVAFHLSKQLIHSTYQSRGVVYVIGNGGSAGIASHFSNDLMKALKIPSQTFYDSNLLTCLANDFGYDSVFSYPIEKLMKPNDLLFAISSSGRSANILNAALAAKTIQAPIITLTGFQIENPLNKLGTLNFWIDRPDYGLVETAHFFILHTIIDFWSKELIPAGTYGQSINSI